MDSIFNKIDSFLCRYFGLDKIEFIPHSVSRKGKQIFILNSESYKRHIHQTPFQEVNLKAINEENKKKLGMAIGKSIANNLIISFDEIIIKKEKKP